MHWKYARTLLGKHGKCIENALEICEDFIRNAGKCMGNTLEIFEDFIRNAWEMHRECTGNIRGIYGDFGTIWDMVYQELGMRENYGKCGMGECGGYWIQWVEMSIILT